MSRRALLVFVAIVLAVAAVGRWKNPDGSKIPTGTNVTVEKKDGLKVEGTLITVEPKRIVLQSPGGVRIEILRSDIARGGIRSAPTTDPRIGSPAQVAPKPDSEPPPQSTGATQNKDQPTKSATPEQQSEPTEKAAREITIPAGTLLAVELRNRLASDTSHVDDQVRATLRRPVLANGVQVLPSGTPVLGHVTAVSRSGRVKGRARVALRFTEIHTPGAGGVAIRAGAIARQAKGTQKRDAAQIGGGAAGGAIVGGILGGSSGAAKGAAIGGAAGAGLVLSTRGQEVRLEPGTALSVKLLEPITIRVKSR